jgi:hypothetical protein
VTIPLTAGVSCAAIGAIVLGLATYALARTAVGKRTDEKSADLALNLFRVLATLLALLLSLTFSDVSDEIREVRHAVDLETSQLSNSFRNLVAYDTPEANAVKDKLIQYIDLVVDHEWQALQQGELSRETIKLFGEVKVAIVNLQPSNTRQEKLLQRLIADINGINETRARRQVHRGVYGAPAFFYVALFGFVWTVALLSVYPPGNGSIVFICFYCAFIGIVIYLTLGLTYNFIGFGAVSPEPLEYLANFVRNL